VAADEKVNCPIFARSAQEAGASMIYAEEIYKRVQQLGKNWRPDNRLSRAYYELG
jgi:hypothetical protein